VRASELGTAVAQIRAGIRNYVQLYILVKPFLYYIFQLLCPLFRMVAKHGLLLGGERHN